MAHNVMKRMALRAPPLMSNVGIDSNKLLAKLVRAFRKPKGLTLITERDKVAILPLLGVGVSHLEAPEGCQLRLWREV
jgi:hypothetical protein